MSGKHNDHNAVVRKINATLRGPVIDALGELMPEIRRLPRRDALDLILDDVELLDRCFLSFRANTEQFRSLLVDRHKVAVEDAEALLECGRSLDEVVSMVVRTAAKRHFRRRLDGSAKRPRPQRRPRRPDLLTRLRRLFAEAPPDQPMVQTRAEILYDAFQEYLLHDWQVPMIPEYCNLSPGLVRRLGPRILDYRLAEDIRRLRADPDNPPPPTARANPTPEEAKAKPAPASVTTADTRISDGMAKLVLTPADRTIKDERARLDEILTPDGRRLKANAFTIVLLDPKVRSVLPDSAQTVRVTGILGSVNGMCGKMLVGELGLRTDQLAVFLMSAHAALGEKRFETAFGVPGKPEYVARIIERAKAFNIGQETPLATVADFITKTFKAADEAAKK